MDKRPHVLRCLKCGVAKPPGPVHPCICGSTAFVSTPVTAPRPAAVAEWHLTPTDRKFLKQMRISDR